MDWSGVDYCDVFISCSSFWRHPFTAEDSLVSKSCIATFLKSVPMNKQSHLRVGWPEGEDIPLNSTLMTWSIKHYYTQSNQTNSHTACEHFGILWYNVCSQGKTQPKQTRRRAKHNGKILTKIRCCLAERKKSIATAENSLYNKNSSVQEHLTDFMNNASTTDFPSSRRNKTIHKTHTKVNPQCFRHVYVCIVDLY